VSGPPDVLVFEGEDAETGIRVRVVRDRNKPLVVEVLTLASERSRWSRPVECVRVGP
jgi:hypothetical protein